MTDESGRNRGSGRKREAAAAFGRAAADYLASDVHREGEDLDRLASWCEGASRALDVATGGGHTAGAVAAAGVPRVVASDVAPEMAATAAGSFEGVEPAVADAERLPFRDGAFDAVTCRIAAHHFPDPEAFVHEVARVVAADGVVAFEDNVVPEEPAVAAFMNEVDAVRDPTHVELYSEAQWRAWFESAGLEVRETLVVRRPIPYEPWVDRMNVPEDRRRELEARFAEAPEEALETFGVEFGDDGSVESFESLGMLLRAVPRR